MQKIKQLIKILHIFIFIIACSKDPNPVIPPDHGHLKILLTDAVAEYDSVNITFGEISAQINGEWISVNPDTQTVNLLDFSNGKTTEIGSENVPVGDYSQIRLKIIDANVVENDVKHPMDVPSGAQSGLKLNAHFEILDGASYEIALDFDAERSVVTTGPPKNPNGYKLKPTIRLISTAVTGSISGLVTNPDDAPVAFAIIETDTVTSTPVDTTNGAFKLAFLPEGSYTISIRDTLDRVYENNNVQGIVGADTNLGSITLQ